QAAKSRPFVNASPLPIAATIALEMIGPIPGTPIKRSQPTSRRARTSISLDRSSIRSSSRRQSPARSSGPHIFGWHQPSVVAKRCEFAAQMVWADAGLHADETGRQIGEPCFHLAERPLLAQDDRATPIETHGVKRVLADIDTDHGDSSIELV